MSNDINAFMNGYMNHIDNFLDEPINVPTDLELRNLAIARAKLDEPIGSKYLHLSPALWRALRDDYNRLREMAALQMELENDG